MTVDAGDSHQRRQHVDVGHRRLDPAAALDVSGRPARCCSDPGAAFKHAALGAPVGAIVADADGTAVVTEEQDEGVLGNTVIVDRVQDAAHAFVERVDHRRMNATPVAPPLVGGKRPAGRRLLPAARRLERIEAVIQRQILLLRLQRRVRSAERNVEEERRLAGGVPVDEPHRVFGQQVRHIPLLVDRLVVVTPVALPFAHLREVVDRRVVAHELGEAAAQRVVLALEVAEVPLAEDAAVLVARRGQDLRQRDLRGVHPVVAPRRDDRPHQTETDRIAARHQAGSRRRTDRRTVEALEPHALGGDPVDVRRRDVAAVEADVMAAEVVGNDEDDVGEGRLY